MEECCNTKAVMKTPGEFLDRERARIAGEVLGVNYGDARRRGQRCRGEAEALQDFVRRAAPRLYSFDALLFSRLSWKSLFNCRCVYQVHVKVAHAQLDKQTQNAPHEDEEVRKAKKDCCRRSLLQLQLVGIPLFEPLL